LDDLCYNTFTTQLIFSAELGSINKLFPTLFVFEYNNIENGVLALRSYGKITDAARCQAQKVGVAHHTMNRTQTRLCTSSPLQAAGAQPQQRRGCGRR
jgi:hypothetical protein